MFLFIVLHLLSYSDVISFSFLLCCLCK